MTPKILLNAATIGLVVFFFGDSTVLAQSDIPEFELGAHFSLLKIDDPHSFETRTEAGFGGRFTYNLNRSLALESEVNFFPRDYGRVITNFTGGRVTQGLFGLKAGIRKERFGFFGKVRPGFVSSGNAVRANFPDRDGPDPSNPFGIEFMRATQFALDVGGVVEFYPSRRIFLRFDLGDTITRYPDLQQFVFPPTPLPRHVVYSHQPQFNAGFGFRF